MGSYRRTQPTFLIEATRHHVDFLRSQSTPLWRALRQRTDEGLSRQSHLRLLATRTRDGVYAILLRTDPFLDRICHLHGTTKNRKTVPTLIAAAAENPCLPPLDLDFYAQLQRIANPKHKQTVRDVIKDTVDLFGVNFQVTMESVFTTLEQTSRMIETTGENRDFKRSDLDKKKQRLMQAIAASLEESLCAGGQRVGTECDYHRKLVNTMKPSDSIISFNYDCLIDETLRTLGSGKWNPRYGYGLNLGKGRGNLAGYEHWSPAAPGTKDKTISLYKLHGSLHFLVEGEKVNLKHRPYTKQHGNLRFTIIPPESNKRYDQGVFKRIWYQAGQALHRARHLVVIGYSFPITDSHSNALFRISMKKDNLDSLVLVNPDREARRRAREVLKRGLGPKTRVIVFDKLSEFAAATRTLWD